MRHRLCIPDTCRYIISKGTRQRLCPCYSCISVYDCTVKPKHPPCGECADKRNCCEERRYKYMEEICDICDLKFRCLTTVEENA